MKQIILPGFLLKDCDIFMVEVGTTVYDKASGRLGVISSVRETANECLDVFVTLEGSPKEMPAYTLPTCVVL